MSMSRLKKAAHFLVAYVLAFIIASLTPRFVHRRDFDRAFSEYYKNPTPENAAALQAQGRVNDAISIKMSAIAAFLLVSFGFGAYFAIRLVGPGLNQTSAQIRGRNG